MNFRNMNLGSRPLTIGIIFGVMLAVVLVLYSIIAPFITQALGTFSLFVDIAIYFGFGLMAGRRASRLTEKMSSGIAAGAIAGVVSSLLAGIYALILTYANINYYVQQAQIQANKQHPVIHITQGYIMQAELEYLVTPLLFSFLLVLLGGTMGAFLGRRRPAPMAPAGETPQEVVTSTATVKPEEEDDETSTPESTYNGNGSARRSAASRRSRNARRNRNTN
jgi:hypothetical protein